MVESRDGGLLVAQGWPGERAIGPATTAATTGIEDKLTIVLAARTHDEGGFPRVPLLVRSLTKFLAYEAVLEMLVVCPDLDVVTFQGQTRQARSSATHGRGCDGAQPSSRGGE